MKTRKIKGGTITKNVHGKWALDPASSPGNAKVNEYRILEIKVLNELAKDTQLSNSNDVLRESLLETEYRRLCERCKLSKDETQYDELKKLKEYIGKIIQDRHEEGLDKLKPNETTEEETVRRGHEYRLKLWRDKYKIIKKLFHDVRRTLHKPTDNETIFLDNEKSFFLEKIKQIDINLASIDRVFSEMIEQSRNFQTSLDTLSFTLRTNNDFSESITTFMREKEAEIQSLKKSFIDKRTELEDILRQIHIEETELKTENEQASEPETEQASEPEKLPKPIERVEKKTNPKETEEDAIQNAIDRAISEGTEMNSSKDVEKLLEYRELQEKYIKIFKSLEKTAIEFKNIQSQISPINREKLDRRDLLSHVIKTSKSSDPKLIEELEKINTDLLSQNDLISVRDKLFKKLITIKNLEETISKEIDINKKELSEIIDRIKSKKLKEVKKGGTRRKRIKYSKIV